MNQHRRAASLERKITIVLEPQGDIDEQAVRRNIKRSLIISFSIATVGVLSGVGAGALLPHHHTDHPHHHGNLLGAIGAIMAIVVGLATVAAVLYWTFRRRSYRRVWQYSWNRKRRVLRSLRKGQPLSAEDRPVADAVMYLNRNMRRNLLIIFPLAIVFLLIDGLLNHGGARWLSIGASIYFLLIFPLAVWSLHRTERNYHRMARPESPPEPTD